MIRKLQRGAVDASLKAARVLPDTAARLTGRGESADLALDGLDAQVRDVAGRLLFDDELRADAQRRRVATRERGEAARLRTKAEQVKQEARETELRRKASAAQAERTQQERIDEQARKERLQTLRTKEQALEEQADAATARDEALRLKRSAAKAKAQRKERANQA